MLQTSGGPHEADVLITACGQLSVPKQPPLPGLERFEGPAFHTARWRHDVELAGRRVAVVGTGCSAIQVVPAIQPQVAQLDVYQRSPGWTFPKMDFAYSERAQRAFARFPILQRLDRAAIFAFMELGAAAMTSRRWLLAPFRAAARRQITSAIDDPDLRRKVTPTDELGCKRLMLTDEWYPTLTRPNVELITDRIERITPDGVAAADGTVRAADVIIYGTGFKAAEFLVPMRVSGRGGRTLQEAWQDGAQAYYGITVCGFPNFFMLYGPNTNLGGNSIIYMLEGQIGYVLGAVQALEAHRLAWLDVRPEVQDAFNSWVQSSSRKSVWESGCHSWYTTASGRNTNNWPDHTFMYRYRVRHFDLASYRVMPATAGAA